ncbi:Pyoverdine/dityrosine biosynthesis protein-domain-containing protein [Xylaria arbuscula]|nr:Pyoverdine/dityrosine biosynthesis protein-domain-containing protein [Xylaria arbuscula]
MDLIYTVEPLSVPPSDPDYKEVAVQPGVGAIDCPGDCLSIVSEDEARQSHQFPISETAPQTHEATASAVLGIIASYGVHSERGSGSWDAFDEFLPMVARQVAAGVAVRMLLPGFPFKENSKNVVLGPLPDLGEELALAHLQGLCDNISGIYKNGAEILICSDGLVYNDLMGVSEEATWEYGEALRAMAASLGAFNIKFIRLWDLLELPGRQLYEESRERAKIYYLEHASYIRQELIHRYSDEQFNVSVAVTTDKDWATTHAAYVGVLAKKAANSPESIAMQMIPRGKAYGRALNANLVDYLRLSIHDSTGKDKISLALIPNPRERGSVGLMPWRSAVAIDSDGSYRTVYPDQIRDTHELVYKNGQPYFFRERSELFDWSDSGPEVFFDHLYPCGVVIRPVHGSPSVHQIPMQKVRSLSNNFSPIVFRGFNETLDEDVWAKKGHELGEIVTWPATGTIVKIMNLRDKSKTANNVTSNEPLPMHFDCIFDFDNRANPITHEVKTPRYQYFMCREIAPRGDGRTLFCNSRLFLRYLPMPWSLEKLEPITWGMTNDSFVTNGLPLIVRHPITNDPCVRWHSPWSSDKTKYSTYQIRIENEDQSLIELVEKMVYDFRTCLRFTWEKGDVLVNDNISMLHTRTWYTSNCDREMWRIHLD